MQLRFVCFFVLLLVAHTAVAGIILPPTIHTVGSNLAICDFNTIQAAIDAASTGDTIRVRAVNYALGSGITISNKSITLVGGFSDCDDTVPDPNTPTVLTHAGTGTVLTVGSVIAGVQNVLVRNFVLRLGQGGMNKGGGVDLSGGVTLRLDNVKVQENQAQYGGGIRIHGGPPNPTLSLEGGSLIGGSAPFVGHNFANQEGGGIHCDGGGLIEWRDASINYNTALSGGGLHLTGCDLTTPSFNGTDLRVTEVRGNSASSAGGGLRVSSGSTINLSSRPNRLLQIIDNLVELGGGGISANGSTLTLIGVRIEDNASGQHAGGVSLNSSLFSLTRGAANGSNCPQPPRCATLRGNQSVSNSAAIHASSGSQVIMTEVFMESNQSASSPAMFLNSGSSAVLRNVQIAGNATNNGAATRLFLLNDAELDLRHVTTALNLAPAAFRLTNNSVLKVHDSILWEGAMTLVDGDGSETLELSCNNASDTVTLPGASNNGPGFRDTRGQGNELGILRLAADSLNIDRCDLVPAPPLIDLGGSARVVDVPEANKGAGPLDRGAFEYEPPLFANGFED